MTRLDGKIAIVTGAASGIGAVTAEVLAREGAAVALAELDGDAAERQAASIAASGGTTAAFEFDLGDAASIERLVADVADRFGAIDAVHNNAAATHLAATKDGPVTAADPSVWDDTFRINVRGTALMIKAVAPHLVARSGGSIVNMSSGAGSSGDLGHAAYGASKAAINAVTMYAATELGKQGIRVNAIAPGLIITPASAESGHATGEVGQIMLANHLTPRLGDPNDVAAMVAFLMSDDSAFITGQIIAVDGGLLAHAPYFSEFTRAAAGV